MTYFNRSGANCCRIAGEAEIFTYEVDKFTVLHNLGSDATRLQWRQTLDILTIMQKKKGICIVYTELETWIPTGPLYKQVAHFACLGPLLACPRERFC